MTSFPPRSGQSPSSAQLHNDDIALALEQRAYDAIVQPYKAVKIYDYFLEEWVPLLGASRALLVIAYRQLAFVVRSMEKIGEVPVKVTLRQLGRWCGQVHRQVRKLHQDPGFLTWFVRPAVGSLGEHPGARSERRTTLVRVEIPLTPADQLRLRLFLEANRPEDDTGWPQVLHHALVARDIEINDTSPLPDSPKSIQEIVNELRSSDAPLPEEIEDACIELHERWITQNHFQATHYFLRRWLPDLTLGLGMSIMWLRRRAQRDVERTEVGHARIRSLSELGAAVGVSSKTVSRWITPADDGYCNANEFILDVSKECEITGYVEAIDSDNWTVYDKSVAVSPQTEVDESIHVGNFVRARALLRRDGSLDATRIEFGIDGRNHEGLQELNWTIIDIRLSEPIHPNDKESYRSVRLQTADENHLPSGTEASNDGIEQVGEPPGTAETASRTKVSKRRTGVSKHAAPNRSGTKIVKDEAKVPKARTKMPKGGTDVHMPRANVSKDETKVPTLRGLKTDTRSTKQGFEGKPQQQDTVSAEKEPHTVPPAEGVVVASHPGWDIGTILEQGAVPRRDREQIGRGGQEAANKFVGWLLFGLAQESI